MITQKLISYKIDTKLLEELDKEVYVSSLNRNACINNAVRKYLILQDGMRRMRTQHTDDGIARELRDMLLKLMPGLYYRSAVEKYIHSEASEESIYDQAAVEACTTDCLQVRQGTCPYRYNAKMSCLRFKQAYNRLTNPQEDVY